MLPSPPTLEPDSGPPSCPQQKSCIIYSQVQFSHEYVAHGSLIQPVPHLEPLYSLDTDGHLDEPLLISLSPVPVDDSGRPLQRHLDRFITFLQLSWIRSKNGKKEKNTTDARQRFKRAKTGSCIDPSRFFSLRVQNEQDHTGTSASRHTIAQLYMLWTLCNMVSFAKLVLAVLKISKMLPETAKVFCAHLLHLTLLQLAWNLTHRSLNV
eukprot:5330389-Amphidinium_carterae.1